MKMAGTEERLAGTRVAEEGMKAPIWPLPAARCLPPDFH